MPFNPPETRIARHILFNQWPTIRHPRSPRWFHARCFVCRYADPNFDGSRSDSASPINAKQISRFVHDRFKFVFASALPTPHTKRTIGIAGKPRNCRVTSSGSVPSINNGFSDIPRRHYMHGVRKDIRRFDTRCYLWSEYIDCCWHRANI